MVLCIREARKIDINFINTSPCKPHNFFLLDHRAFSRQLSLYTFVKHWIGKFSFLLPRFPLSSNANSSGCFIGKLRRWVRHARWKLFAPFLSINMWNLHGDFSTRAPKKKRRVMFNSEKEKISSFGMEKCSIWGK